MNILVTGGSGYIGTHTLVVLLENNHQVVVVDNLSNSSQEALTRVTQITGKKIPFYNIDIRDKKSLEIVFKNHNFDTIIHFAGLKAVEESIRKPLEYYDNNVNGTLTLCTLMKEFNVKSIIFSSSATVYGNPSKVPITETAATSGGTNPYARTKYVIEEILKDISKSDPEQNIILLRYFNPIGAHESGLIGENPKGIPNNLLPYITQTAVGKRPFLSIFGDDYPTPDGTGIRDYIHVVDLALGHLYALKKINDKGVFVYNLGTGQGYSVLEIVKTFEKSNNIKIPYKITDRRKGDIPICYADPKKATLELGWKANFDLDKMCKDSWKWQANNPDGYDK